MKTALGSRAYLRLRQLQKQEAKRVKKERARVARITHPKGSNSVNAQRERSLREHDAIEFFHMKSVIEVKH